MCYYPLKAFGFWKEDENTGELKHVVGLLKSGFTPKIYMKFYEEFDLPCGKCIECLEHEAKVWSFRIMNEASLYKENCMVTLTYKDSDHNLHKDDLQKFMKRLRKKYSDKKIRFFACGEYGSKGKRPHYHVILFNHDFKDKVYHHTTKKGFPVFVSKELESIWKLGISSISQVETNTAKYCAKYLQKLRPLNPLLNKPFNVMSNRPGIGKDYILQHTDFIRFDKLYSKGDYISLPRYYLDILEREGYDLTELKHFRDLKAKLNERSNTENVTRCINAMAKLGLRSKIDN